MDRDFYREVTDQIMADLEKGIRPWRKPWDSPDPVFSLPLRHNGEPYRGINVLALWSKILARGYRSPYWMTYKQAQTLGGQVRRGERGTIVTYAAKLIMVDQRSDDSRAEDGCETVEREVFIRRRYVVFNAEQADGLQQCFYTRPPQALRSDARIALADDFFANTGAAICMTATTPIIPPRPTISKCRPSSRSAAPRAMPRHWPTSPPIGPSIRSG
jgi:antirestriction protein ArdC